MLLDFFSLLPKGGSGSTDVDVLSCTPSRALVPPLATMFANVSSFVGAYEWQWGGIKAECLLLSAC
jgi:hypothetical protein